MAGGTKRHDRFARPPSAIPEAFEDEDKTPLPVTMDEAIGWQHIDRRMVAVEAAVGGYTRQVDRHEQSIAQWSDSVQKCIIDVTAATARLSGIETNLSRDWARFSGALDDVTKALGDLGQRMTKLEGAVESVGRQQTEQAAKLIVLTDRVDKIEDANTARNVAASAVKAERRRWFSWANAAYVVITAAIAAAGYLAGTHL